MTILIPLIFGLSTVILIKSLTAVVWLVFFTISILCLVLGGAARTMIPSSPALEKNYQYIDYILVAGAIIFMLCVVTYAMRYVRTLRKVRHGIA